jgi:hypothetical protein
MEDCEAEGLGVPAGSALESVPTSKATGRFAAWVLTFSVASELVLLEETLEEVAEVSVEIEAEADGPAAGGADGVGGVGGDGTAEATVGAGMSGSITWGRGRHLRNEERGETGQGNEIRTSCSGLTRSYRSS